MGRAQTVGLVWTTADHRAPPSLDKTVCDKYTHWCSGIRLPFSLEMSAASKAAIHAVPPTTTATWWRWRLRTSQPSIQNQFPNATPRPFHSLLPKYTSGFSFSILLHKNNVSKMAFMQCNFAKIVKFWSWRILRIENLYWWYIAIFFELFASIGKVSEFTPFYSNYSCNFMNYDSLQQPVCRLERDNK